jgi:H+/Cl- antiporter ClcA
MVTEARPADGAIEERLFQLKKEFVAALDDDLNISRVLSGLFALVGASAFAGAVHRTLLAPVVFLAETTGQAALVVPALVATVAAFESTRNE